MREDAGVDGRRTLVVHHCAAIRGEVRDEHAVADRRRGRRAIEQEAASVVLKGADAVRVAIADGEAINGPAHGAGHHVVAVVGLVGIAVDLSAEDGAVVAEHALRSVGLGAGEPAVERDVGDAQREAGRARAGGCRFVGTGGNPDLVATEGYRQRRLQIGIGVRPRASVFQAGSTGIDVNNRRPLVGAPINTGAIGSGPADDIGSRCRRTRHPVVKSRTADSEVQTIIERGEDPVDTRRTCGVDEQWVGK